MINFKAYLVGIIVMGFACSAIAKTPPSVKVLKKTAALPDLIVESVVFNPLPKDGEDIGLIKISVVNYGKGNAAACTLNMSCLVAECNKGSECEETSRMIYGDIAVPALKSGEKTILEWKSPAPVKWVAGKYSLVAEIDKYNVVQEADEVNNIGKDMIYVTSFSAAAPAEKSNK